MDGISCSSQDYKEQSGEIYLRCDIYFGRVGGIWRYEQSADYIIYAKTGWTGTELQVGWYVGYVEKGDENWLFAMNMRMDRAEQAPLRKKLTIRSLRALGLL